MEHHDVLIAGGGIAGLTAAARLAADGRTVALADPAPAPNACPPDLRTTALLQPALETLRTAGIWPGLERIGAPLRVMRLVDAGGREQKPRETADFTGAPAGADLFGWNLPNQPLKDALWSHLQAQPSVTLLPGTKVTDYTARMDRAFARLSDGSQRTADLIVAADGRDSTLRDAAGIAKRRWGYGQKALVFAVTHPNPHDGVSTEIHRTGGPLTLVPLPDHEGRPASSIVWMMRGAEADAMAALDDSALALELTARTMGLYGPLEIASKRALWPIISQAALQLTARRLVLVAEAAHVMPPIGAQGLNTSL
ncbi:MAG: FAD-dependent monooxygenase, partial [Pseudomonadota bacterium]